MTKFKPMFESEDNKNLVHEIMTGHGYTLWKNYRFSPDSWKFRPDDEENFVDTESLHSSLIDAGWKHTSRKLNHVRVTGIENHKFEKDDLDLMVTHERHPIHGRVIFSYADAIHKLKPMRNLQK